MEIRVYEYEEGDEGIAPGVTIGTDVVGYDDDGKQVLFAGVVKKKGRFLERQVGGDVEARMDIPKTDAVFLGEEESEARKKKIKNIVADQKEKVDKYRAEKAEKEERRLAHEARMIDRRIAQGILEEADIDQELENRGFGKDQKEKIKDKRAEKPE